MGNSLADGLYYLWYRQDEPRAWIGRTSLAGAPGVDIPVNPLRLADVFTVMPLPPLTQLPAVVQRIDTDPPCNYVLTYVQRQPISEHLLARSEYIFPWKADTPRRLARIEFLDNVGMKAMTAELSDWRSIDTEELEEPPAQPPLLAHRIKLTAWDARTRNRSLTLEIILGAAATRFAQYSAACRLENALPDDARFNAVLIDRREPR
jgi:hypothetical protein